MDSVARLKETYAGRLRDLEAAVERRDRELSILAAVGAETHGLSDVQKILDLALGEILEGLEVQAAWVFLGDQREQKLRLAAQRGLSQRYLGEVQERGLGECLCPEVFTTGHRMQARNTRQCPRMPDIVEDLATPLAHACIPLRFEGTSRGVLNVACRPGQEFSEDELRFLDTLGHQLCLAIERADSLNLERLRNQEARALAGINKAIGGSLDAEAVLTAVGDTALEVVGADRVHILLGSDPRHMTVAHLSGLRHPALREKQTLDLVALGGTAQAHALGAGSVVLVNDWRTDPHVNRQLARTWDSAAALILPLLARERALGLLVLTRRAPHRWSPEQVDVAEALAAQAAVALENVRLYEEARRSLQELRSAQARIIQSEKMAVLGTFASGLAHEVRNPLNSIALQLSILERRAAGLADPVAGQLREVTGIIREEVRRLDSLVSDFLLFSRTNVIQHRPADLEALLDEVVRLLRPEARASGVTLRRQRLGETTPPVPMDAEKMKQVVINLIRNAIEAMPDGGVVVVESGVVEGRPLFVVRDNGPGLPEGLDVFQLFVTTKPRGTGLGLSIAQQIVLEHGGEIAAWSEPGHGTSFTVSLGSLVERAATEETPA